MLASPTHWIWDSWYIKEGDTYHAYFMQAPKDLGNSDLRHTNARVGHATSQNLIDWDYLGECFTTSHSEFDSKAIWTGSIIKVGEIFHYFYTGLQLDNSVHIQKIGHAISKDLYTFHDRSSKPILEANPEIYVTTSERNDEPFRDPWVFYYDGKWQMFVTASRRGDTTMNQGVVARATSDDLVNWKDEGPIIENVGMGQLEVTQIVEVDGQWFLIFCNHPDAMLAPRLGFTMGTYSVPAESPRGPFDFTKLSLISHHYAGRVLFNPAGRPVLMGFLDKDSEGRFIGVIDDPVELRVTSERALRPLQSLARSADSRHI